MSDVYLPGEFFRSSRGVTLADGGGVTWSYDKATNVVSVAVASGGIGGFNESVDDRVAALLQNGTGISWTYNDGAGTLTPAVSLASFSTTNLSEGTNLYFTDERAQDAVFSVIADSSSIDVTYNDAGNTFTLAVLPAGVNHNALLNYAADEHVAHSDVTLTAGAGLTGGGTIAASRTFAVGAGTGITVNADDVAINQAFTPTWTGKHTFTGGSGVPAVFGDGADNSLVQLNGGAAKLRGVQCRTAGATRWFAGADDAAESGSTAGSNFVIYRFNDAGSFQGTMLEIARTGASIVYGNTTDLPQHNFKGTIGFNGTTAIAKPTVTGSRGANAALASLLTALANYGLITDSSS
jgi:hypothetical protein